MENIQLGILFILGFFIINIRIKGNKNYIQEGFTEYFDNYSL